MSASGIDLTSVPIDDVVESIVDEDLCARDTEKCFDKAFEKPKERVYNIYEQEMLRRFEVKLEE